jgi:hypothetical protein
MGVAARHTARDYYCWPAIVDQLTNQYQAVIDRTQQKRNEAEHGFDTPAK